MIFVYWIFAGLMAALTFVPFLRPNKGGWDGVGIALGTAFNVALVILLVMAARA